MGPTAEKTFYGVLKDDKRIEMGLRRPGVLSGEVQYASIWQLSSEQIGQMVGSLAGVCREPFLCLDLR